jgi:transposase
MARPRRFDPEFRANAVALYLSGGRPISAVADELGIGRETLRQWVRQAETDRGVRHDRPTTDELEELRRLRQENAELRRANEILKLASSFFARELDPTRRRP